jgi:hypothetical protein
MPNATGEDDPAHKKKFILNVDYSLSDQHNRRTLPEAG